MTSRDFDEARYLEPVILLFRPLQLIDKGLQRDEAYRVVQKAAGTAWETRSHLRSVLSHTPEVTSRFRATELDDFFDEARYLEHVDHVIKRLDEIEIAP